MSVVIAGALSACGTTVPTGQAFSSGTAESGRAGDSQGGTSDLGGTAGVGGSGSNATGSSGITRSGRAPVQRPGADRAAQGTVGGDGGAVTGAPSRPGSTKPLRVGIVVLSDVNSAINALGINASVGDQEQQAKIMAAWLNANGGVAGRKVELVVRRTTTAEAETNLDSWGQGNCTYFTEDQPVQWVWEYNYYETPFLPCLVKHGVGMVDRSITGPGDQTFAQDRDFLYDPSGANLTRSARTLGGALADSGFLSSQTKIGYFHSDSAGAMRAASVGMHPALASRGLRVDAEATFPANGDASQGQNAATSAVLKFKAEGITRVLLTGTGSLTYFAIAAESQGYRPRYGISTDLSPNGTSYIVPQQQLNGAAGAGWQPGYDVGLNHEDRPVSTRETLCRKLMKSGGVDMSSETTAVIALNICDSAMFLKAAADAAHSAVPTDVAAAVAARPVLFTSAVTFASDLARGHDGASEYRMFAWQSGCTCFQYTSPPRPLPR